MPKRGRDKEAEDYESDGGFVENDDGDAPSHKKNKKGVAVSSKTKEDGENKFWELSSGRQPRRVAVEEFKGAKLISIREFYEKNDEYLPGKKGISLNIEQYKALVKAIPEINASLKAAGIEVGEMEAMDDDQKEEFPKKRVAKKKGARSNIEETSDEEE